MPNNNNASKQISPKFKDITGQKFNHLTVKNRETNSKNKQARWLCLCDCGNKTITTTSHLKNGHTRTCGCKSFDDVSPSRLTHGHAKKGRRSKTFYTWSSMKDRCFDKNNKRYYDYGGRGIVVCKRWINSFDNFLSDMGEKPNGMTLERINNSLGYAKDNCRWATLKEQSRNKRNNVVITINGETKILQDWCDIYKINPATIRSRVKRKKISYAEAFEIKRINNEKMDS